MGIRIQDYPGAHYVRIEGINYDYALLKALGHAFPVGAIFKIIGRGDTLTVERIYDYEPKKEIKPEPTPTPAAEAFLEGSADIQPEAITPEFARPRRRRKLED